MKLTKFTAEIDTFLACYENKNTKDAYRLAVIEFGQYVVETWDIRTLNGITLEVMLAYRAELIATWSSSTVNNKVSAVKKFMEHLYTRGIITNGDYSLLKTVTVETEHQKTPTHHVGVLQQMFATLETNTASDIQHFLTAFIATNTGARREEVVKVLVKDVINEDDNYYIFIRSGKGFKARNIAITATVYYRIQELLTKFNTLTNKPLTSEDYIIAGTGNNSKRGKPVMLCVVNQRMGKIGETCDIDELTPHSLRRSYATALDEQMEKNGVDMATRNAVLYMRLGHAKMEQTIKYLSKDRQKRQSKGSALTIGIMGVA